MTPAQRLGSDEPCPHCGATSGVLPASGARGHVCAVCGGPRIVVDPSVARPRAEREQLVAAKALTSRRAGWGIGAGIASAVAGLGAVVGLISASIFDLGAVGWSAVLAISLGPALFAGFGWSRVGSLSGAAAEKLRAAEEQVAVELFEVNPTLTAAELARMMHVPEARAYELLAHGEVAGLLHGPSPRERVRVDDSLVGEDGPEESSTQERFRS